MKIGEEAFAFYAALGSSRSYSAVAEEFGVTKRGVALAAKRGDWAKRVAEMDGNSRQKLNQAIAESLQEMNERHLKMARYIQSRSLEALKSLPIDSAFAAVRALKLSIDAERLIRGEPTDHQALSVEEIVKREYSRWLAPAGEGHGHEPPEESDKPGAAEQTPTTP